MSIDPTQIPDLARWHTIQDVVPVADTAEVASWPGRGVVTPLTPSGTQQSKPHYKVADELDGHPALYGITSGTSMRGSLPLLPREFTVTLVWRRRSGSGRGPIGAWSNDTNTRRFTTSNVSGGLQASMRSGKTPVDGLDADYSATDTMTGNLDVWNVVTLVNRDGESEVFINGNSNGPTARPLVSAEDYTSAVGLAISSPNTSSSNSGYASIREVAVWGHALTAQERAGWHSWVQDHHGIQVVDYVTGNANTWSVSHNGVLVPATLLGVTKNGTIVSANEQ